MKKCGKKNQATVINSDLKIAIVKRLGKDIQKLKPYLPMSLIEGFTLETSITHQH